MILSSIQLFFVLIFSYKASGAINTVFYDSVSALLFMAVFSTAAATVIYYKIIQDYGPSFLSLVNYPIPIFAFFAGVIILGESFNFYSIISLCLSLFRIHAFSSDIFLFFALANNLIFFSTPLSRSIKFLGKFDPITIFSM